jgi:hypothetical protein
MPHALEMRHGERKMSMTEQQHQEFEAVTRPVIEWLNANCCHPHVTVMIEPTSAVLSEGTIAYTTNDYLCD